MTKEYAPPSGRSRRIDGLSGPTGRDLHNVARRPVRGRMGVAHRATEPPRRPGAGAHGSGSTAPYGGRTPGPASYAWPRTRSASYSARGRHAPPGRGLRQGSCGTQPWAGWYGAASPPEGSAVGQCGACPLSESRVRGEGRAPFGPLAGRSRGRSGREGSASAGAAPCRARHGAAGRAVRVRRGGRRGRRRYARSGRPLGG
jgi:hypothetical protein